MTIRKRTVFAGELKTVVSLGVAVEIAVLIREWVNVIRDGGIEFSNQAEAVRGSAGLHREYGYV